jgi:hypothetical protein
MNEVDERGRAIGRPERHNCISPFDCIEALKCKLLLTRRSNRELMISGRGIKKPQPAAIAKLVEHCRIAMWDWIGNNAGDQVERNVVDTKPLDEVRNVVNVLLVRLGHKYRVAKPTPIVNLTHLPDLLKGRNGLPHNWKLFWSILYFVQSGHHRCQSHTRNFEPEPIPCTCRTCSSTSSQGW